MHAIWLATIYSLVCRAPPQRLFWQLLTLDRCLALAQLGSASFYQLDPNKAKVCLLRCWCQTLPAWQDRRLSGGQAS